MPSPNDYSNLIVKNRPAPRIKSVHQVRSQAPWPPPEGPRHVPLYGGPLDGHRVVPAGVIMHVPPVITAEGFYYYAKGYYKFGMWPSQTKKRRIGYGEWVEPHSEES